MTRQQRLQRDRGGWASAIAGLLLAFCPSAAAAQVAGDGTLGTQVNGALTTPCTGVCIITDGATRGSNLFHSFRQFSLPNGDFAGFVTTPAIQNVIDRVTGIGQPFISNINGTIATSNPANFFLLNPNGIIFGPGATLNVGGSFLATTANAIQFGNQGVYSATNPETPPLLTVNPSALWFNQAASGAIAVQSTAFPGPNLQVSNGRSLVLVGGDISISGGQLSAPGGRVELLGIASSGTVALNNDGTAISLNAPLDMARSDIRFDGAALNVRADGGGSITLDGRNIEVLGGSFLLAGIAPGLGTADSRAGDIMFRATGAVTIGGGPFQSLIFNRLGTGALGRGGT